ncbi:PEP-CTERM sorting domain-containing protein [Halomicronema sp. CCY15110]|uniref:PEP-CTERM sorting domain-containing protein n=1 Tax=Halomicronema sp. CCY15110 TaxID=2767773 RepID=UPI00194FF554|nr:PEP-CTERM sorting domain-containing protein [Halomicronema sp. CCY15110]
MKKQLSLLAASSLLAAGALAVSAIDASALDLTGNVTCSTSNLVGSSACEGAFEGNNSNQDLDGLFGIADWGNELFKLENGATSNGPLTVTPAGGTSGNWSITQSYLDGIDDLMFVIKGGPTFSAYLWDGLTTSGTWNTDGIEKGNGTAGPGLSHFSIYSVPRTTEPPVETVPEPAAMAGLLAVGAGIVVNRRKKAQ